ncbi:MAG: response regulator [Planctomycetes bacterium]|nr:response regulator [Planctomycetota bacterium]
MSSTSGVYLTRPARDTLLSLADAALQRVAQSWSLLVDSVVSADSPEIALRERYDIQSSFTQPCLHAVGEAEGAVVGPTAFLLRSIDAVTLAGLMVRSSPEEIRRKRSLVALSELEIDAAREALNQLCGAYARGLREMLEADISLSLREVKGVHLSLARTDHDVVFRWNPWISISWRLGIQGYEPSSLLQILPLDTARALLVAAGVQAFTDRRVGRALFISDNLRLHKELQERFASSPLVLFPVRSLAEAYDSLARDPADLLLLDLGADKPEGLKRCQTAHSHPRSAHLPLVVTSDLARTDLVVSALKAGARDFLVHPLEPAAVVARLATLLPRLEPPKA